MSLWQLDDLVHRIHGPYVDTGAIPSLCVPALTINDASAGVSDGVKGVSQLPAPVSLAASWNPSEANQYGSVVGSELAGKGVNVELGPTVNIVRDPRWGRAFESYGEDPYLSGQIADADIEGVQSQGPIAMVKHFALYNQETFRNTAADNVIVSDRVAHEIYMPQFQAAVQQGGAGAVMCSYSTINGVDACQDPYLTQVLDHQWGFGGFVMSDGGATHSTVAAANAGLEDMESRGGQHFGPALVRAVEHGQVALSTLKQMASRVLTTMFAFGLFNRAPRGSLSTVVTSTAHAAVARSVADEGTVLLKNSGGILPLGAGISSIAVIGDDGGTGAVTAGGGSTHVVATQVVTPLQGITNAAAPGGEGEVLPGVLGQPAVWELGAAGQCGRVGPALFGGRRLRRAARAGRCRPPEHRPLAGREQTHHRGLARKPQHRRRAQHGVGGDHAVAQLGQGRGGGVVPGPGGRRRHRRHPLRESRSFGQAAGHVPCQPGRRPRIHARPMAWAQPRGPVLRGVARGLPLVRRQGDHATVSLRVRIVVHDILVLESDGDAVEPVGAGPRR